MGCGVVGHAVKQPKTDSPLNHNMTPPKSLLEGYKLQVLNIKIIIIIIILLLQLCLFPIILKNYYQILLV